jgi:hypothetical protein
MTFSSVLIYDNVIYIIFGASLTLMLPGIWGRFRAPGLGAKLEAGFGTKIWTSASR